MTEAIELDLTTAESIILDLDDTETVTLDIIEQVITLEVLGEVGPRGLQGIQGEAATIIVGTTTTSVPGTNAGVTNVGDTHDAIFDFTIPRGDVGPQGIQGFPGLDTGSYRHVQGSPAAVWVVQHDLGFYPAVSVQDSAGSVVVGDVTYLDANSLLISFDAAFGGFANLS